MTAKKEKTTRIAFRMPFAYNAANVKKIPVWIAKQGNNWWITAIF